MPSGSSITRRDFIGQLGAAAMLIREPVAEAAQSRRPPFDLLVAGGHIIDASQGLSALRDVALAGGSVARVAAGIPPNQARQVFDARGRFVTPGLIDLHGHVFDGVAAASIDPALVGTATGVTTIVDAGSAGAVTFPGFRRHVIDRAKHHWFPDTISTDIHRGHVAPGGLVFDLVTTKFLGLSVDQVVERVTTTPARVLNFPERIGTLKEGTVGDVTILELVQGDVELFDSRRQRRVGRQRLKTVATIRSGAVVRT